MSTPTTDQPVAGLSQAIAQLTHAWGKPSVVRGGSQTLSALFSGIDGSMQEIFAGAGAVVDFLSMAPQRLGGPPDMGIVTGRISGDGVTYMARVFPSASEGRFDVDIRLEMQPNGASGATPPHTIFETMLQLIGDRLYEDGVYAQFMAHLLSASGRHRARFYGELAQLVADYVRSPEEAP